MPRLESPGRMIGHYQRNTAGGYKMVVGPLLMMSEPTEGLTQIEELQKAMEVLEAYLATSSRTVGDGKSGTCGKEQGRKDEVQETKAAAKEDGQDVLESEYDGVPEAEAAREEGEKKESPSKEDTVEWLGYVNELHESSQKSDKDKEEAGQEARSRSPKRSKGKLRWVRIEEGAPHGAKGAWQGRPHLLRLEGGGTDWAGMHESLMMSEYPEQWKRKAMPKVRGTVYGIAVREDLGGPALILPEKGTREYDKLRGWLREQQKVAPRQ